MQIDDNSVRPLMPFHPIPGIAGNAAITGSAKCTVKSMQCYYRFAYSASIMRFLPNLQDLYCELNSGQAGGGATVS